MLTNNLKNIKTKPKLNQSKLQIIINLRGLIAVIILHSCISTIILPAAAADSSDISAMGVGPANGLLIFLDDSEAAKGAEKFALGDALLNAILQDAGPIVVSASLLNGLREFRAPRELDPFKLKQRYDTVAPLDDPVSTLERKGILLAAANLPSLIASNWVIKQVNSGLYLLLPKQYLGDRGIKQFTPNPDEPAKQFLLKNGNATQAEHALGLKVNYMRTVTFAEVRQPGALPDLANYFIDALRENQLFVPNSAYYAAQPADPVKAKNSIPNWSIYLKGHGLINYAITDLSPAQFKDFLNFLENKISTRLLYYVSCHAAGVNSELIYKNLTTGIQKSYSYAIITQALTDAVTSSPVSNLHVERGVLKISSSISYTNFLDLVVTNPKNKINSTSPINYAAITTILNPNLTKALGNTPQIKLPGVPWFSVLDNHKVISIGEILAKTRTSPLNIATFFSKISPQTIADQYRYTPRDKSKPETVSKHQRIKPSEITSISPLAILLYTQNVPFELIINTSSTSGDANAPAIISMLPGDATHHIKQITSNIYPVEQLLNSFLQIDNLKPQKIFLLDLVTYAPTGAAPYIVQDAIVILNETANIIYFKYGSEIYKSVGKITATNQVQVASPAEKAEYARILAQYSTKPAIVITPKFMRDLQAATDAKFTRHMTVTQAIQNVTDTLNSMPDNTVLTINTLNGEPWSPTHNTPWRDLFDNLGKYRSGDMRKILWINRIDTGRANPEYTDIIIDCQKAGTKIFFTIPQADELTGLVSRKYPTSLSNSVYTTLRSSFVPLFDELFDYFRTHTKLPEKSESTTDKRFTHELLTPESIAAISTTQQIKAATGPRYHSTADASTKARTGGGGGSGGSAGASAKTYGSSAETDSTTGGVRESKNHTPDQESYSASAGAASSGESKPASSASAAFDVKTAKKLFKEWDKNKTDKALLIQLRDGFGNGDTASEEMIMIYLSKLAIPVAQRSAITNQNKPVIIRKLVELIRT